MGGTFVTLTGLLSDRSFACRFGTAVVSGHVDSVGKTVCTAPATESSGLVQVQVKQAGDETTIDYEYYVSPNIARVWPSRGDVAGGTVVSVRGEGLQTSGVACKFGDAGEVFGDKVRYITSTLVACIVPSRISGGKVTVDVSLNGGVDFVKTGFEFIYEATAGVEELSPSRGFAGSVEGGQPVTIVGQYFARSEDLKCRFGLNGVVEALFTSSSKIVCLAPERGEGVVRVSVSNNGVDFAAGTVKFEYVQAGHVVSLTPSKGPTSGSTRVTIQGDGRMALGDGGAMCVFGSVETDAVAEGSTVICVSPRVASVGKVQFVLRDKSSGTQVTGTARFEYYVGMSITSLVPSAGNVAGGGIVTVIGSGLSSDSLVSDSEVRTWRSRWCTGCRQLRRRVWCLLMQGRREAWWS